MTIFFYIRDKIIAIVLGSVIMLSCKENKNDYSENQQQIINWANEIYNSPYIYIDSIEKLGIKIDKASKNESEDYQAININIKGLVALQRSTPELANYYFYEALKVLEKSKTDSLRARTFSLLGKSFDKVYETDKALDYFQKASNIYKTLNIDYSYNMTQLNIAQLYFNNQNTKESQKILSTVLGKFTNKKSKANLLALHLQANIYGATNEFAKALKVDDEGIVLAESAKSNLLLSPFYNNKANCYLMMDNLDSALVYFKKSLHIDSLTGIQENISDNLVHIAVVLTHQKKHAEADKLLLQSVEVLEKGKYYKHLLHTYQRIIELKTSENKTDEVIKYQNLYIQKYASFINEESEKKLADAKIKFETAQKESTIKDKDSQLNFQKLIIASFVLLILLGLLSLYLFLKNRKQKQQQQLQQAIAKQQELSIQAVIEAEERERQRMASDLHDGLGQLLSATKLNLQAIENTNWDEKTSSIYTKALNLLDESTKEVRNVSHNIMPNSLIKSGLGNAIKDFVENVENKNLHVKVHVSGLNTHLEPHIEIITYRIVQEVVNNVIKHAKANLLDITITVDHEILDIMIEDNGVGFDISKMKNNKGIGLNNIETRVKFLQGQLEIDSKLNQGTVVTIHIPINKKQKP